MILKKIDKRKIHSIKINDKSLIVDYWGCYDEYELIWNGFSHTWENQNYFKEGKWDKKMKDFMKVMGSLIDRILGYMLAIMFAISFFIKDISTVILSGVILIGFTIISIYVENVSRRLEALKELEKILGKMEEEDVLDEEN